VKDRHNILAVIAGLLVATGYAGLTGKEAWSEVRWFVGVWMGIAASYSLIQSRSQTMSRGQGLVLAVIVLPLLLAAGYFSEKSGKLIVFCAWVIPFLITHWMILKTRSDESAASESVLLDGGGAESQSQRRDSEETGLGVEVRRCLWRASQKMEGTASEIVSQLASAMR
jgi:hypothetical protein